MNITTDLDQVSPDDYKPIGGYEWWYFDGQSTNGDYAYVIIFYHINPFSTTYINELEGNTQQASVHPAVSISIYHKSKPIYYSFLEFDENEFEWNKEELSLRIENHHFKYELKDETFGFEMELDQLLASGHRLKGTISGRGDLTPSKLIQSSSKDEHVWNLILPRLDVAANLVLTGKRGEEHVEFEGTGYHDHNTGYEPMKESFRDWYWGRYHFPEYTLVYYLMEKQEEKQFEAWLIDSKNQRILEYFDEADLQYFTPNWFGLKSARKIELKNGQVTVNIQCSAKIDDGPFYQRFRGESIIKYNGQVQACQGISEYIYPQNIYKKRYWPLVHMRLRYMEKEPHWVQKSPLMYPWTW